MRPKKSYKKRLLIVLLLVVILGVGYWLYSRQSNPSRVVEHPEYLSFTGDYVFTVPQDHIVDELSVPGLQLLYRGQRTAKTLEEGYATGAISLQPIKDMPDHNSKTFKKYVKETLIPEFKKNVPQDHKLEFKKFDGWDVARITFMKDSKPVRFVYVKNGQHPVIIVSKEESEAFKQVERTITDIETSDLKDDNESLKQEIKNDMKLISDKNGAELYKNASSFLRSKITEAQLTAGLQGVAAYSSAIATYGAAYKINPIQYSVILVFGSANKDLPTVTGYIFFEKINGQLKLKEFQLPSYSNPAGTSTPQKKQ